MDITKLNVVFYKNINAQSLSSFFDLEKREIKDTLEILDYSKKNISFETTMYKFFQGLPINIITFLTDDYLEEGSHYYKDRVKLVLKGGEELRHIEDFIKNNRKVNILGREGCFSDFSEKDKEYFLNRMYGIVEEQISLENKKKETININDLIDSLLEIL